MGWEYSDTDCKYANVCSFSPRCVSKSTHDCNCYEPDHRGFFEKHFGNQSILKAEYEARCKRETERSK